MIRWAHGLLRVWAAFTVLWISVSGLILWGEKPAFDFSNPLRSDETISWDAPRIIDPFVDPFDPPKIIDPFLPIARQPVFDPSSPIRPLVSTKPIVADAGKIIGPPILLLFIGCALWWIGRGFRPAEPKPNRRTP